MVPETRGHFAYWMDSFYGPRLFVHASKKIFSKFRGYFFYSFRLISMAFLNFFRLSWMDSWSV